MLEVARNAAERALFYTRLLDLAIVFHEWARAGRHLVREAKATALSQLQERQKAAIAMRLNVLSSERFPETSTR